MASKTTKKTLKKRVAKTVKKAEKKPLKSVSFGATAAEVKKICVAAARLGTTKANFVRQLVAKHV
jgi:hypothetical protein